MDQPFRPYRVQTLGRANSCHHLRVRSLSFQTQMKQKQENQEANTVFLFFSLVCLFALIGAWIPPRSGSPFDVSKTHVQWYVVPAVGIGSLIVGYTYYLGFAIFLPKFKRKDFVVERRPVILRQFGDPDGPYVFVKEYIDFWWAGRNPPPQAPLEEDGGEGHELDPVVPQT